MRNLRIGLATILAITGLSMVTAAPAQASPDRAVASVSTTNTHTLDWGRWGRRRFFRGGFPFFGSSFFGSPFGFGGFDGGFGFGGGCGVFLFSGDVADFFACQFGEF